MEGVSGEVEPNAVDTEKKTVEGCSLSRATIYA